MITVLDYGAGNLRSVENTLAELGATYKLADAANGIDEAQCIILPGVGHFGQLLRALDESNLRGALIGRIRAGVPFLGICLGLQALFESSEEAPGLVGLAVFPGKVARFPEAARVPHMGWNSLQAKTNSVLLNGLPPDAHVYFANSYYVPVIAESAATCTYSVPFTAVLESGKVFGVQFHPEKSGPLGLKIVRNFLEFAC